MFPTRHHCAGLAAGLIALCAMDAAAQTVRVRTETLGRGTQLRRSDLTRDAERTFSQSVSVWGWNAVPVLPGTLDVHASARYLDDFGVAAEDRRNPFVETEISRFIVDIAQVRYQPIAAATLTMGRQWMPSALGMRDIDGARLRLTPTLAPDVGAWVDGFAGREVASGWATIASDSWDVQGLPIDAQGASPGGLRVGGDAGLRVGGATLDLAWQRRTEPADAEGNRAVGDERIGAGISGNVHRRVAISSSASYHTQLDAVDRADLHVSWREPLVHSVLSLGIEHRLPWFDAASIFNVFGARPYEGAYATWQLPVAPLRTTFEARGWGRAYDANLDLTDLGGGEDDARALGGGAGHDTRFRGFGRQWTWRSFASAQTSVDRNQGGAQWLLDSALRFPAVRDALIIESRFLGLWSEPGRTSSVAPGGAFTALFGIVVPATFGELRVQLEGQSSDFYGPNLNAYASFSSELWL